MAYKPKVLEVLAGGTGLSSTTANQLIYSSSTNVIAELANGTTGQVLMANTGAAPSWGSLSSSSYWVTSLTNCSVAALSDAATYFLIQGFGTDLVTVSGSTGAKFFILKTGTITKFYGVASILPSGTLGSNENVSVILRLNNTTDTTITSTLQLTARANTFNNTGLSIAVTQGDYVEIKVVCPTWATNPSTVTFGSSFFIA